MSTPASCLLSRLLSAHRRAGSPPLAAWPVWPDTRAERGTFDVLVAHGLLVETGGAWLLTERALSPIMQLAAAWTALAAPSHHLISQSPVPHRSS